MSVFPLIIFIFVVVTAIRKSNLEAEKNTNASGRPNDPQSLRGDAQTVSSSSGKPVPSSPDKHVNHNPSPPASDYRINSYGIAEKKESYHRASYSDDMGYGVDPAEQDLAVSIFTYVIPVVIIILIVVWLAIR